MLKKRIAILLTFLLAFSLFTYPVSASTKQPISDEKIMSYDLSRYMTAEEINYLKNNPNLAKKRYEKDMKFLMKQADEEMNRSSSEKYAPEQNINTESDFSIASYGTPYSVTLGTDRDLALSNAYDYGTSWYGLASSAANSNCYPNGEYADVSASAWGVGDASSWAWTGAYIYVSGSGSKYTKVKFWGPYKGSLKGSVNGSASGKVRCSIYDLMDGQEVGNAYVAWDETSSSNIQKNADGSLSGQYATAYLEGGHYYLLRYGVSNTVSCTGPYTVSTDFWNNGAGAEGIDFYSITVDFQ